MQKGVKATQHQIDGLRRERKQQNHDHQMKIKFPIIHLTARESIPFFVIFILAVVFASLVSCKTADLSEATFNYTSAEVGDCDISPFKNSDWTFKLKGFVLYHTDGLESMALSGSHTKLNKEYCYIGKDGSIPGGLGDFENKGYAGIREYDGFRIAMYHPSSDYPDNWIIYNPKDGAWSRWDLGHSGVNSSHITRLRFGTASIDPNN